VVKVTGPLFSLGASGTLGKTISYRHQLFGDQVEKKPKKRDLKSVAQLTRRGLFQGAVAYWNGLSDEEKEAYKSLAAGLPMTGFNLCVRDYLVGVIALGVDVEEGGEVKVAGATKLNFLSAFDVADEGDGRAGISLDVDESPLSGLAKLGGRVGGQGLFGGSGAGEHLTLQSTAHATRGYVRAQDDLQLLSNIVRDSGGTARLALAPASPHLTLTGDVRATGHLGLGALGTMAADKILHLEESFDGPDTVYGMYAIVNQQRSAGGGSTVGIGGLAVGKAAGASSYVRGLMFAARHQSTSDLTILQGLYLSAETFANMGAVTLFMGGYLFAGYGANTPVTTAYGLWLRNFGHAQVGAVYGFKIDNQENAIANINLEVGPATPYFRVEGGGAPAGVDSRCLMSFGGTLYRLTRNAATGAVETAAV